MTLITAQTEWWVELDDAKVYLDETTTDNDALIQELIYAVQSNVEEQCDLGLNEATFETYLDKFPLKGIEVWHWPVASIESVKYTDGDGVTQTVTSTNYGTDLTRKPARIVPIDSYSWPDTKDTPNAVQIQYKTGFTSPAVLPGDLKQAMYMILSDWFKNRGDKGWRFPRISEKILNKYKYK